MAKRLILNEQIKAENVRLLDEDGTQLGIMPFAKALELARSKEVELALVAVHPETPVCKLLDYGKHQYQQNKLASQQKTRQKKHEIKGVRIGFNTSEHDLEVKINMALGFLKKNHPIKVQLQLRGREMAYKNFALDKAKKFAEMLAEHAELESAPRLQGFQITMILNPKKTVHSSNQPKTEPAAQ